MVLKFLPRRRRTKAPYPMDAETALPGVVAALVRGIVPHGETYVDTYCKIAQAEFYTTKTPTTAADMPNDKVPPFYERHELSVLHILTDHGIASARTGMTFSCSSLSMRWTIRKPSQSAHKQTVSVSISTRPSCKSFTMPRFAKRFMLYLTHAKPISTSG